MAQLISVKMSLLCLWDRNDRLCCLVNLQSSWEFCSLLLLKGHQCTEAGSGQSKCALWR